MEHSMMSLLDDATREAFDYKKIIESIEKSLDGYITRELSNVEKENKRFTGVEKATFVDDNNESVLGSSIRAYCMAESKRLNARTQLLQDMKLNIQAQLKDFKETFAPLSRQEKKLRNILTYVKSYRHKVNVRTSMENSGEPVKNSNETLEQLQNQFDIYQTEFIREYKLLKKKIHDTILEERKLLASLSNIIVYLMNYHTICIDAMREAEDKIEGLIGDKRSALGDLEEHLNYEQCDISHVINDCVCYIMNYAKEVKGIFRLNAPELKLKKLLGMLKTDFAISQQFISCEHTVASLLKRYLMDIPSPLIPFNMYDDFKKAVLNKSPTQLETVKSLVSEIPVLYQRNLQYVIKFLVELSKHSEKNMLDTGNVGIIFGPCLLRREINSDMPVDLSFCDKETICFLVKNYSYLFPNDIELNTKTYYRFDPSAAVDEIPKSIEPVSKQPRMSDTLNDSDKSSTSNKPPYHITNQMAYDNLQGVKK